MCVWQLWICIGFQVLISRFAQLQCTTDTRVHEHDLLPNAVGEIPQLMRQHQNCNNALCAAPYTTNPYTYSDRPDSFFNRSSTLAGTLKPSFCATFMSAHAAS